MGNWHMGFWWWVKALIAIAIMSILYIPYFMIKPFSLKRATQYTEFRVIDGISNILNDWVWGKSIK